MIEKNELVEMTVEIISAYALNNTVTPDELYTLIEEVYKTLQESVQSDWKGSRDHKPMVPINQSIFPDYIICLEDGKAFKSLKRHLKTKYEITPEEYRGKWNLPANYPMVAPNYAKARSALAKEMGLGKSRLKNLKKSKKN